MDRDAATGELKVSFALAVLLWSASAQRSARHNCVLASSGQTAALTAFFAKEVLCRGALCLWQAYVAAEADERQRGAVLAELHALFGGHYACLLGAEHTEPADLWDLRFILAAHAPTLAPAAWPPLMSALHSLYLAHPTGLAPLSAVDERTLRAFGKEHLGPAAFGQLLTCVAQVADNVPPNLLSVLRDHGVKVSAKLESLATLEVLRVKCGVPAAEACGWVAEPKDGVKKALADTKSAGTFKRDNRLMVPLPE